MSATKDAVDEQPRRGNGKLIVASLALAAAGAGGGYFAMLSDLLPFGTGQDKVMPGATARAAAFVPVDPIVISLGASGPNRHLSFRAQLEVPPGSVPEVEGLMPRIVDVLNSYLRAVDIRQFDTPHGLVRLRAQMLRRVQIIVGDGMVNDLLVMEFVLN
jgi:flagellar FliL protein